MIGILRTLVITGLFWTVTGFAAPALFDMTEIRDASTLKEDVQQDWHTVSGKMETRQKVMTISVGQLWPGQDYRVPVRLIVPADTKAKGFWLTGGHQLKGFEGDAALNRLEAELLEGGVGIVHTIVQEPGSWGQKTLGNEMYSRFLKTLNPRYSIQYWGWPASLMRAITAAYAEEVHFEMGKVAVSGGSKNGASPSVALIHDERITAQHGTVSPLWESPLRLCDSKAWNRLRDYNKQAGVKRPHRFLGGTYGPVYNEDALRLGRSWAELEQLAGEMADAVFISKNFQALEKRGAALLFEPGTHDFVCFDVAWGGEHYPEIPVFYPPNSGHGKKGNHPGTIKGVQNREALLLHHFFPGKTDSLLPVPEMEIHRENDEVVVTTTFPENQSAEGGRLYWMFDRPPEGSDAYLKQLMTDENWVEMEWDEDNTCWSGRIPVRNGAASVDLFSSHWKRVEAPGRRLQTAISSPYRRVVLK
ncbi:hypothetical protein PDESU_04987 [Pontiella desulfatans]|uniref:Uncharacterized protein n=1 Tax=Pontiella desulfatans TaxID=2750659 RepID=A0A6C2UAL5_PONDE|nr:hypothetical protein [Pontiella desulfatans]VGO16396.1 hypothetical protein PDESU_04987 [Pontiella desulfatans]